ncbi:MAG: racemase [Glaciihabitans sp.]|nr:racemase [Glaciihabitans sp.]
MSSLPTIARIAVRPVVIGLTRPWGPDVDRVTFLEVTVEDSDGATGVGFSWTPTIGAASVEAMLRHDIAAWAIGRETDAVALWGPLWAHLHEAGGGGVTTIAMSGLDTALWDLAARRAGLSLSGLMGERRTAVPAYGSGINLHYDLEALEEQAERWVTQGFDAVKIKVGSPDIARDVARVGAVRAIIGDRRLMLDANQRWDLDQATEAMRHLDRFGPAWIEEPLRADDLRGYRALSDRIGVPIACGENLHTAYRFAEFANSGAVGILQPNLIRIGGITPLQRIAADCAESGVELALHLLPELSGQVALTLPQETAAEIIDGALLDDLAALSHPAPVVVSDGWLRSREHIGIGIEFTQQKDTQ